MAKDNTLELAKLVYEDGETFVPSEKERKVLSDIVLLFRDTQSARDKNFQYFDGSNLIDYIDDSVRRFNTNVDERDGIEDWQAGVHVHFTRNKVLGILGKVLEILPIARFTPRGDEDAQRASILSNVYEFVEELDDYEEFMTHLLLESIVKGTGIGYEDIDVQEKTYRDVEGIGDDITVTENKEKTTKIYASIVPLEEFYPASVSIRKIKDMPYCFWRKIMPYSKFVQMYGHLRKSQLVSSQVTFTGAEARPYYVDFLDSTMADGSVEVIRFYDKMNDQYVIIANGIWINPINTAVNEEVSPLPWNHKELPFWDVKFDHFGDFFYGKSLPDRLKSMQDVLNVLTNMLLDQSFLTIFPPLITTGFDDVEDDYLRPGRRIPIDTQGLPINSAMQVLDLKTPSGWHQYILDYTRQVLEESSLDKVSSGIAGQGDRTTAQEIRVAASGVAAMLQMFARMVNIGIKRKAMLKAANIIQFGFNSEAPILRRLFGEGDGGAPQAFATIQVGNTHLTGGKRGTKLIEVYGSKEELPSRASVQARAMLSKVDQDTEIEIVAIPSDYLRNFAYDVKLQLNPKNDSTMEAEKALQLEKVRVYMSFFPQLVNMQELAATTAEKMGDDPTKILNPDVFQPVPAEDNKELDPGMGTEPQGAEASNTVRSMQGGEGAPSSIAALQRMISR